jgi:uncharacterized membrane protein YeaQ/YmgE (transglycosylase-associated protein family)
MPSEPSRPADGPDTPADAPPPTALPSVTARALGFVAIVVSGAVGAFIGWGFTDLQCHGDCSTPDAIGALVGAVIGAGGVAVVVVLALRAMGEWNTIQRRPTGPARPAIPPSKRPRVR